MSRLIATVGYVGLLRPAPGTWGSAVAIPMAWVIHGFAGLAALVAASVLVFAIGWWATAAATRGRDDHDPSEIVIDEVVGQWIALWPLSSAMGNLSDDPRAFPLVGCLAAFALFRLFDVWKPWPVSWADQRNDAFGVMLDDVLAGVIAAVAFLTLVWLIPKGWVIAEYLWWIV